MSKGEERIRQAPRKDQTARPQKSNLPGEMLKQISGGERAAKGSSSEQKVKTRG
jgi:hypothetical protein